MTNLSPFAQVVLDATGVQDTALEMAARGIVAAALRAATGDAAVFARKCETEWEEGFLDGICAVYADLEAIADELEAQP
jgi:hypothetical protein